MTGRGSRAIKSGSSPKQTYRSQNPYYENTYSTPESLCKHEQVSRRVSTLVTRRAVATLIVQSLWMARHSLRTDEFPSISERVRVNETMWPFGSHVTWPVSHDHFNGSREMFQSLFGTGTLSIDKLHSVVGIHNIALIYR